jgi:hypothetical protein
MVTIILPPIILPFCLQNNGGQNDEGADKSAIILEPIRSSGRLHSLRLFFANRLSRHVLNELPDFSETPSSRRLRIGQQTSSAFPAL